MPRPLSTLALPLCAVLTFTAGCTVIYQRPDDPAELPMAKVRPGISVFLADSVAVLRNKKVALLTNQTAVDEKGKSDADLLRTDARAVGAGIQLVALMSPEHGLGGNADHENIASTRDSSTGLPVYSLYANQTVPPPDSLLKSVDVVAIDLQDIGSRTWTYEGAMVYTMRAAARLNKPVVIFDRPNPITGSIVEGPMLDSALSNPDDPASGKPGLAYALGPIPLRHGMTMGELARYYNASLNIKADLHVIPVVGWRREVWFDRTGLPFIQPSPNLPSFHSVMLYPALVPFEATNISVGRGSTDAFQIVGAPWLNTKQVIQVLKDQVVRGVRFLPLDFTPLGASDKKYEGQLIHGIRIEVTDRSALQTTRLAANLFAALHRVHPTEFTVDTLRFDRLLGSPAVRQALLKGEDPDAVVDRSYGPAYTFREQVKRYLLY